jgi:hypothetical protein
MASTKELFSAFDNYNVTFAPYSRFSNHPVYMDPVTRTKFIGTWTPPVIQQKETDILYEIPAAYAFRPDMISYDFYSTPLLAWVIAYVNNITNPLDRENGFYAGRVIRITDINTLSALTF